MAPRILVIEDDPDFCATLRDALEAHGCEVVAVGAMYSALEVLANGERPDLVLLDLVLPDLRKLPAVRAVRSATRAPIVVMTALSPEDVPRDLPVETVLHKPFAFEQLRRFIRPRPGDGVAGRG